MLAETEGHSQRGRHSVTPDMVNADFSILHISRTGVAARKGTGLSMVPPGGDFAGAARRGSTTAPDSGSSCERRVLLLTQGDEP